MAFHRQPMSVVYMCTDRGTRFIITRELCGTMALPPHSDVDGVRGVSVGNLLYSHGQGPGLSV